MSGTATSGWAAISVHHQDVPERMAPTPTKSGGASSQPAGISGGGSAPADRKFLAGPPLPLATPASWVSFVMKSNISAQFIMSQPILGTGFRTAKWHDESTWRVRWRHRFEASAINQDKGGKRMVADHGR